MLEPLSFDDAFVRPKVPGAMRWIALGASLTILVACGDDSPADGGSGGHGSAQGGGSGSNASTGGNNNTGSSTGGSCEQYLDLTAQCDQCVAASCCDELAACKGSEDCAAVSTCIFDDCEVGDDECNAACQAAHPIGYALLEDYATCWEASCMTPCSSSG